MISNRQISSLSPHYFNKSKLAKEFPVPLPTPIAVPLNHIKNYNRIPTLPPTSSANQPQKALFGRFFLTFVRKCVKIPVYLPAGKRQTALKGKVLGPAGPDS